MRKSKEGSRLDKERLASAIQLFGEFDRCTLHLLLPDITYGTMSARVTELANKKFIVQTGYSTHDVDRLRSYRAGTGWNPSADPNARLIHGELTTKKYEKTKKWDLFKVLRFLERKN